MKNSLLWRRLARPAALGWCFGSAFIMPATAEEPAADERERTRTELLDRVGNLWRPPPELPALPAAADAGAGLPPLQRKLEAITVPLVSFTNLELNRVVGALNTVAEQFDTTGAGPKGVNLVLIDPGNANPPVTITLRNLPLKRILDLVTDAAGYQYEVQADAVVIRPGGERTELSTEVFPVARSTVVRLTGAGRNGAAPGAPTPDARRTAGDESDPLRRFFQQAGVNFDGVAGSSLAYDGSAIIVTQTPRRTCG